MKILISTFILILASGCTHLSSVSTTSIPAQKGPKVKSEAYKFIFFAFNFSNEYVDGMATELAQKCPRGKVQGILTKHESIMYFPLIAHAVRVTAEGYCSERDPSQRNRRRSRRGSRS